MTEDGLVNCSDRAAIIELEANGFVRAERYAFGLDPDMPVSSTLILNIHRIAFHRLYEWAGKWRNPGSTGGWPPSLHAEEITEMILRFTNELNYKIVTARSRQDEVECLAYAHHAFLKIKPFDHGNSRTGSVLLNFVAKKLGYKPLALCRGENMHRIVYLDAMKHADKENMEPLNRLIEGELEFLD
jgi:cell filamentation protein